ncbi:MAG: LTA synthase family protein [Candidatus Riflebacteria bacterium]|nr:LTA synthase family protein [Candidatus Riflebacteria bacterium]
MAAPDSSSSSLQPTVLSSLSRALHELARGKLGAAVLSISAALLALGLLLGHLPGRSYAEEGPPALVAVLALALCLTLHLSITTLILLTSPDSPPERVCRRVSSWLLLAVVAGLLPNVRPATYAHARYLGAMAWCLASLALLRLVLPDEVVRLWRRVPWKTPILSTLVAGAAVGFFETLTAIVAVGDYRVLLACPLQKPVSLVLNMAFLALALVSLSLLTGRPRFAFALGTGLYALLAIINAVKLHYLDATVQVTDTQYLLELFETSRGFLLSWHSLAFAAGAVAWAAALARLWRTEPEAGRGRAGRWMGGTALALVLCGTLASMNSPAVALRLRLLDVYERPWDSRESWLQNGTLLELALGRPEPPAAPAGYGRLEVERAATGLQPSPPAAPGGAVDEPASLLVYLVESLADPAWFRAEYSADPTPFLRRHWAASGNGLAMVPHYRFGSADVEFEILTGMSTGFLPPGVCAYKQLVKRALPSLPRVLRARGYRSTAINSSSAAMYNRTEVYGHLGFDRFVAADRFEDLPRSIADRLPAEEAVIDGIVHCLSEKTPSFVLALYVATHFPYNRRHASPPAIVVRAPVSENARLQLQDYVNRLHEADTALGRLHERLTAVRRRVLVVVLGDHLPPLSTEIYDASGYSQSRDPARCRMVPLVVWSNFARTTAPGRISTNCLGALLCHLAKVPATGLFALTDRLLGLDAVLQHTGSSPDGSGAPPALRSFRPGYEMLQYDLLLGSRFWQDMPAPRPGVSPSRPRDTTDAP